MILDALKHWLFDSPSLLKIGGVVGVFAFVILTGALFINLKWETADGELRAFLLKAIAWIVFVVVVAAIGLYLEATHYSIITGFNQSTTIH